MKISFGMIVINGEPFIKYNLENLYQHAHEILIVEGAVEKFKHAATPNGHSLDETVNIIKVFPDPENKIRLIQRDGFWTEKDEMSNAYMQCCTGDYIWQIDVDEFYKHEDIESIRNLLMEHPNISRIDIQTINFWKGFRAVIQGASYCFGADKFRRIFKFEPGYRYATHRPPTVTDSEGRVVSDSDIVTADELANTLGVFMYHYSYVFDESVRSKVNYYARMGWGAGCDEGDGWIETDWLKFSNPLRVHLINFPPSWIVPFNGEHPDVINQMIQDLRFKDDPVVEEYLNYEWIRFAQLGEYVVEVFKNVCNRQVNKYYAVLLLLKKVMLPIKPQVFRADLSILKAVSKIMKSN